jgi:hypothetical protein
LGLVCAVYAQSGIGAQLPAQPRGPQEALQQWPIVAGSPQPPSAQVTDRRRDERGTAPSTRRFCNEAREVHQQLYEQIARQTDSAIRA